ncbi:MAG: hypothetical protein OQL20_13225, partial [Sedimenticola sp.]|nr:hypothetical protein [Sedimenticola sp.]
RLVYTGPITPDHQQSLLVTLDQGKKADYLLDLPGVSQVEPVSNQQYRVTLSAGTAADIADAIINRGDRLFEMRPEGDSLEQTFSRLTLGDGTQ